MTIIISHRGNLDGPSSTENNPLSIDRALSLGFDVEIDIWCDKHTIFLGHDNPQYKIDLSYLTDRRNKLWIHCKNLESLFFFSSKNENLEYFWHQNDDYTLTKNNFIWTFPNRPLCQNSIAVMPLDEETTLSKKIHGICTDYPNRVKEFLLKKEKND